MIRFPVLACIALVALSIAQTSRKAPILFENAIRQSGIDFILNNAASPEKHQIETMISGVALFDYNNDGLLDIYFVNGAALPSLEKNSLAFRNRLYRNNGDGTFTDVTEKAGLGGAGYGMGVAVGDYDNHGWEDLYLAGVNRNQLFHNNGDGTFTDVTDKAGVSGISAGGAKPWSISAGWFDYNNDGKLDLLVVNYVDWKLGTEPVCMAGKIRAYCSPDSFNGEPDILYRNNADGTFTDVSAEAGLNRYVGKGMGLAFADYDRDGYTDVFISNDTFRNFLFHNNRDGTFTDTAITAGVAYNDNGKSIAGMGVDFRDVDNDGKPDIWVSGMTGDTFPLFHNEGRYFSDVTWRSGIGRATTAYTGWGLGIVDLDNDGWKDLFCTRAGILDNSDQIDGRPAKLPNLVLRNLGLSKDGSPQFEDVSAQAGPAFQAPGAHRGVAFGDLNNDGRIDAVVVVQNVQPEIWMNHTTGANHWLLLKLEGVKSNRDGLGARIKVTPETGGPQWNECTTATGFSSASDKRVHFGLGTAKRVSKIEIWWPSGEYQSLENVPVDRILSIREGANRK